MLEGLEGTVHAGDLNSSVNFIRRFNRYESLNARFVLSFRSVACLVERICHHGVVSRVGIPTFEEKGRNCSGVNSKSGWYLFFLGGAISYPALSLVSLTSTRKAVACYESFFICLLPCTHTLSFLRLYIFSRWLILHELLQIYLENANEDKRSTSSLTYLTNLLKVVNGIPRRRILVF